MIRRAVDVLVAMLALLLLAPLLALIATGIRLESRGSPFYRGVRVGRNGRLFRMWKFRTMVRDARQTGPPITGKADPRITRVGSVLRRTKLDELPQFLNLLLGDLTLVGPRPEVPEIVSLYTPEQREVLSVKPGITGPAQVQYTTEESDLIPEGVAADAYYVEHLLPPKLATDLRYIRSRTARSDLQIVLRTIGLVLRAIPGGAEIALWCCGAAVVLVVNLLAIGGPRIYNDGCQYLSVADNVLEGNGFASSIIHFDVQYAAGRIPAPMTVFPVGYPALIAALTFVGVRPETGGLLLSFASFVLLFPLLLWTGRLFGLSRGAVRWALLLLLFNGAGWIYAASVQTEALFTALSLLVVGLVSTCEASPSGAGRRSWLLLGASVCAGMGVWVRYPGVFLVASLAVWYGLRFLRRPCLARLREVLLAGISILIAGACLARNLILVGDIRGGNTKLFTTGIGQALRDLLASFIHLALGPRSEFGAFLRPGVLEALLLAGAVLLAARVAGEMRRFREADWDPVRTPAFRFAALWVAFYVVGMTYLALHSPISFGDPRYFFPVLPPVALIACSLCGPLLRPGRRNRILGLAAVLLTVAYCGINVRAVSSEDLGPVREIQRLFREPTGGGETVRSWIDHNVPQDGVVIAASGQATAYVLGRKTLSLGIYRYSDQDWAEATIRRFRVHYGARVLVLYPNMPGTREIASRFPFVAGLLDGRLPPWIAPATRSPNVLVFWLRDTVEPPR